MNIRRYAFLLLPVVLISACGGGDLDDILNVSDPKIRFVHAAPAGPNVTLYRNDTAQSDVTNVGYKSVSGYRDVDTGSAQWRLRHAGNSSELDSINLDARRGDRYTLVALAGTSKTELLSIRDPYTVLPVPTIENVRIRMVNGSSNAQHLDAYLTSSGTDLDDTSPTLRDVDYRTARPRSGEDSLSVLGKKYRLRLTEAGTRNVVFDADLDLPHQGDWLLVTVPASGGTSSIRVLAARINRHDDVESTLELTSR